MTWLPSVPWPSDKLADYQRPQTQYVLKGLEHYTNDELATEMQRREKLKAQEVEDAVKKLEALGYKVTK